MECVKVQNKTEYRTSIIDNRQSTIDSRTSVLEKQQHKPIFAIFVK